LLFSIPTICPLLLNSAFVLLTKAGLKFPKMKCDFLKSAFADELKAVIGLPLGSTFLFCSLCVVL